MLVFYWCFNSLWLSFLLLLLSLLLLLLLFQYYYYCCYCYYYYCCYNNYYHSTVFGISTANFEPILLSKKSQRKSNSQKICSKLIWNYKYFLQSFNILIEIWCFIWPHKFFYTGVLKKTMLGTFRFVSYGVTRLSSPDLCSPLQERKRGYEQNSKKSITEKSTYHFLDMLILWAYFWVFKTLQVWRTPNYALRDVL